MLLVLLGSQASAPQPQPAGRLKLFKDSRAHLASAIANDQPWATVVMATASGEAAAVVSAVVDLGGRVRIREDEVGYVRADIPPRSVDRLVQHPGVVAAALSVVGDNFLPSEVPEDAPLANEQTPADVRWLQEHPYRPQADLGIDALRKAHPEFDGRGVTVAVLDGFIDLLLPAFADALDVRGSPVPKVIDQANVTDPTDGTDPYWIDMSRRLSAGDSGIVSVDGEDVVLPGSGEWRLGRLSEARFADNAYLRGDLNRDGNPEGASREFLVAWNPADGRVWVDANQNGNLADDRPLREYRMQREIGVLGEDRRSTAERDTVGYTVTIDEAHEAISINLGAASHGTEIAGALVAARSQDGLTEGIAPGATLINYWHGSTAHGLIEGALRAFRDPRVDLVVIQQNVFLTMDYALDDGGSVIATMLDRLVERYGKPAFAPASNIPGPVQLNDVGLGPRVFAVGAYESRASWLTFAGVRVPAHDNISSTGSFGPAGSGRLKPDFVAPTHAVTPNPGFLAGGRSRDLYALPPGRAVCGGTSCATPMAAGVAVSLLSAARQHGINVTVDELRWALTASARAVDLPAHAAGAGLLRADAAWTLLSSTSRPPRIEVRGDVRTALSSLRRSGVTAGTFVREGDVERFAVTLRRTSGPSGVVVAALHWRTKHPPFRTADTVELPLNTEVSIEVELVATDPGLHSAVLAIADPSTLTPWHLSLHAVVVPLTPGTDPGASTAIRLEIDRPGIATIPVRVPEGTAALNLHADASSPIRMYVAPPDRKLEPFFGPSQSTIDHVVPAPSPGTWFVTLWDAAIQRDRTSPTPEAGRTTISFSADLHRIDVSAGTDGVFEVRNAGAAVEAAARNSALALRTVHPLEGMGAHIVDLQVPAGAEWLTTTLKADAGLAPDLYLFQCKAGACGLVRTAMGARPRPSVFVPRPASGRWRLVVDSLTTSPGGATVVVDVADPALGSVVTNDTLLLRRPGDRWSFQARAVRMSAEVDGPVVARSPIVAAALLAPTVTAPPPPRGGGLIYTPSWFPLAWIEEPSPGPLSPQ